MFHKAKCAKFPRPNKFTQILTCKGKRLYGKPLQTQPEKDNIYLQQKYTIGLMINVRQIYILTFGKIDVAMQNG